MEVSMANAPIAREETPNQVSDMSSAASETTSLLPAKTSEEDTGRDLSSTDYGTLGADLEQAHQDVGPSKTEKRFSNSFVARTVIALLIGTPHSLVLGAALYRTLS